MWRFPLVLLLAVAGCGSQIGDSCKSNLDCSPFGDRFCDVASRDGYCTEEDCNVTSCPGEAVCIRFFTTTPEDCNPILQPGQMKACSSTEDRCVCDQTDDKGVCTNNVGHCAPSSTERHWCMRKCSHDSDCRDGYECRRTGSFGAEPIPTFDMGNGSSAKFCAPKPTSS